MAKRKNIETTVYVARGANWHVTYDRQTKDYAAFADEGQLVLIGFYKFQTDAVNACRKHMYETLQVAA